MRQSLKSTGSSLFHKPVEPSKPPTDPLVYDFSTVDREQDDVEAPALWDVYTRACYSRDPPIPALSLMRPILGGDQSSAFFAHHHIADHLPVILDQLARTKIITEMDLTDNSLTAAVIGPLISFVTESDQLSLLLLDDNPMISAIGIRDLIDGIKDCRSLETFSIENTGCTSIVGHSIAEMITNCSGLLKLNISNCRLRQSALEIAQALPATSTLKRLKLSKNELFYGQRRLGVQLGINAAKCASLTRIDLSQNALSSDAVSGLLRGLSDSPRLHALDLSRNEINEPAGRAVAGFLAKCSELQRLDISQNPILNVTLNAELGQKALGESAKQPGAKKNKKPKKYVPGCYLIISALARSASMQELKMHGLVVDIFEWERKLAVLGDKVTVNWRARDAETFRFRPITPRPRTTASQPAITKPNTAGPKTPRRK